MATRSDIDGYQQSQSDVRTLAIAALVEYWATLDLSDPTGATAGLLDFVPALVAEYGEASASMAADWYDSLREESEAPGSFSAQLLGSVNPDQIAGSVQWAATPLYGDEPNTDQALARLADSTQRHVHQQARDTIADNADIDPGEPMWARVPTGDETCAWCLILASRGAEYGSKDAAAGERRKYHDLCDCVPTPIWPDSSLPEGYDPDALLDRYVDARDKAKSGDIRAIAAVMRADQGIR